MDAAGTLYVGTPQGLFYSTDQGGAWHGGGLNGDVRSVVYDAPNQAVCAAVYGTGVHCSAEGAMSWEPFGTGLGSTNGLQLGITPDDLFLAAESGGVWRTSLLPGLTITRVSMPGSDRMTFGFARSDQRATVVEVFGSAHPGGPYAPTGSTTVLPLGEAEGEPGGGAAP